MPPSALPIKEFDGARSIEMSSAHDLVFLEAAGHCYAFDRAIFLHAVKSVLNLAFVVENATVEAGSY